MPIVEAFDEEFEELVHFAAGSPDCGFGYTDRKWGSGSFPKPAELGLPGE